METYYLVVGYLLTGLLGLCVGSFLNVVIYRLPEGMSLAKPASHCPQCGYQLKWYDNIPLLSYLFLGGKCRSCKKHIPFRYTAVELANMVLWLLCAWCFGFDHLVYVILCAAVCSVCLCVFFIDLEHQIIYDRFQIILLVAAVASLWFDPTTIWWSHFIGGIGGFALFWLVGKLAGKFYGREALGGGDIKLAGVMGLFLGWQKLILAVLVASVGASIVLMFLRRYRGDDKQREYPFAPFLTVGFVLTMFLGTPVIEWYNTLLTNALYGAF